MAYSDTISELLIKIKNAHFAKKDFVEIYYSNARESILKILKEKGFILDYKIEEIRKNVKILKVFFKYGENKSTVIRGIKRVSKPSRRIYQKVKEIKPIYNGYAVSVYSTNKGILTGKEAVKQKVGGEFLFYIW